MQNHNIYVGDFNTSVECANAAMQLSQLNPSGVNYGFGYEINNKTSCYAFSNCGDACAIQKMGNQWRWCVHKLFHIGYIDLIFDICLRLIFLYNDFLYFDNEFNRCTFKCLQAKRNWAG